MIHIPHSRSVTGSSISQKENVRPRNQRDDGGKKGGNNDANNKNNNAGNKRQNRRVSRRSFNSASRPMKGDDMKQRNNGVNMAPNMMGAAN